MVQGGVVIVLTKKQLMEQLHISRNTVDRHMAQGMPHIKLGRSVRFELADVLAWYNEKPVLTKQEKR